ncbi:MAG: Hsp20/alpha crystallin family protein [Methylovirgula sp.]
MADKVPVKSETKSMTPSTLGPWVPFESLRREVDQIFDRFTGFPSFGRSFGIDLPFLTGGNGLVAPAVDIVEKEKEYEVTAELPGLDEKNIDVKVTDNTLTIKGEKSEEKESREKDRYLSERRYGSFVRTFSLPAGVDASKIEANFTKGVLTVKLPKTAEALKNEKKIEVKAV